MGLHRLLALYRRHFRDRRRERMFLASASFFVTFAASRLVVYGGRNFVQPFELWIGGIHIHHYVWGILLLLVVGYLWLIQVGSGPLPRSHHLGRMTAALYGAGAALTLDEFALWLHLDDVYWERTGRMSIDAVMLFGALVSAGLWGGPFWRALINQYTRVWRRRALVVEASRPEAVPLDVATEPVVLCPTCGRMPDALPIESRGQVSS